MSQRQIREPRNFGTRRADHSITISRNGRITRLNVNPVFFSIGVVIFFFALIGYFGSTAYLMFRDDLIGAQIAREARIKHEYEDRIATLRTKLDLVTSRQLLDQQAIENKVAALVSRQEALGARGGDLEGLIERAKKRGLSTGMEGNQADEAAPQKITPQSSPNVQQLGFLSEQPMTGSAGAASVIDKMQTASIAPQGKLQQSSPADASSDGFSLRGTTVSESSKNAERKAKILATNGVSSAGQVATNTPLPVTMPHSQAAMDLSISPHNQKIFGNVAEAIDMIDSAQRQTVDKLRVAANQRSRHIAGVLKSIGVDVPKRVEDHIGGPYIPLDETVEFDQHLNALDQSLDVLDSLNAKARAIPVANPAPGKELSSGFGARIDPFNGNQAMHAGLDFRGETGDKVYATSDGIVINAAARGGYGNLVEIQHANGYSTRYGHLSRILVADGEKVVKGQIIGLIGSTGRSTGPHLHYEIRRNGLATNPYTYLKAGSQLKKMM